MAETCEHKPTIGCALTAVPGCCACADKRPLATAYPLYIDGQGMRLQGRRWQRYCWKCRDYWNLHSQSTASASLLSNPPTPYAAVPSDQTLLPTRDSMDHAHTHPSPLSDSRQQSWSFDGINEAQHSAGSESVPIPPRHPYNPRGTGYSSHAGTSDGYPRSDPLHQMFQESQQAQQARLARRAQLREGGPPSGSQRITARQSGPNGDSNPSASRRRERAFTNPFGTREEIESENYQSPITAMFGRAWNRYRQAEEERSSMEAGATNAGDTPREATVSVLGTGPLQNAEIQRQVDAVIHRRRWREEQQLIETLRDALQLRETLRRERDNPHTHPQINPIDSQPLRPRPLDPEEMAVNGACRICCEQKIDTLLEPCMHVAICHWCSDLLLEQVRRHRSILQRLDGDESRWKCPICRRAVVRARRVYLA
ncbi:uncharacterized protein Z519_02717 [Cladophialophora bantiana CBS 173.52]|uniref:RING-type domain-containing protein n=1 Tax=Cladophialophora bantiana (strain ATCC 10958 / CBS 173.52 / CDC B-1940 / NIH 8579) TaxID=1442370 RepID=A0A0D2I286_CLAB1|nr:uncharacterized protein Z519_02717 [Cladophialophora bantiana CBS 173.52]KIW97325.1 hypothetical protein Z519_02717 [Cladophialophora bantiana CBS 173.52]